MQGNRCTLKWKTLFPDLRCNFSYPSAKILTSRFSLIYIYFIHTERCCKENYLISCCLFPLSIASNRSCSFQGWSLSIPSLSTSYFLCEKIQHGIKYCRLNYKPYMLPYIEPIQATLLAFNRKKSSNIQSKG